MPFVDETIIEVSSGRGGAGAATFRREKYVPKGGPDGGDGGCGGDVVFEVRKNLKTLSHLANRKALRAEDGRPGCKRKRHGRDGRPLVIEVPPGTLIRDADSGKLLCDMTQTDRWVFLRGGKGGRGNVWFKSSTRQAPRYAQRGLPGAAARVLIELNLIADICFVGLPNAGKSTLLGVLTNARPRVASYPFTTKIPNLGVLDVGYDHIILADIPGIIEGASSGAGLGIRFLKHITRTKAIALLLDCSRPDPVSDRRILLSELERYHPDLPGKPRLVIGTKIDLPEARERCRSLVVPESLICVSSHSREGIDELIRRLADVCGVP